MEALSMQAVNDASLPTHSHRTLWLASCRRLYCLSPQSSVHFLVNAVPLLPTPDTPAGPAPAGPAPARAPSDAYTNAHIQTFRQNRDDGVVGRKIVADVVAIQQGLAKDGYE